MLQSLFPESISITRHAMIVFYPCGKQTWWQCYNRRAPSTLAIKAMLPFVSSAKIIRVCRLAEKSALKPSTSAMFMMPPPLLSPNTSIDSLALYQVSSESSSGGKCRGVAYRFKIDTFNPRSFQPISSD
jgi:hypothetical protein